MEPDPTLKARPVRSRGKVRDLMDKVTPAPPPGPVDEVDHLDHRALLAAIVESSDDAIVSKTLEGRILSWNPGATRIFGYQPAEVIGKPITIIIPEELHAEELQILAKLTGTVKMTGHVGTNACIDLRGRRQIEMGIKTRDRMNLADRNFQLRR